MKLHFDSHWLRKKIARDPDGECEAGIPIRDSDQLHSFCKTSRAVRAPETKSAVLGVLIRQLRRRDQISREQLAQKARIDVDELRSLEENYTFIPRPRTFHQLATYFQVSPKALMNLSAAAVEQDRNLEKAAYQFAASSDDLSKLSQEERRSLNNFIKLLASYKRNPKANAKR